LLPNLSEEAKASKEQTREFIASLRNAFDKALVVGEANYHIGFSIGVTLFNTNENTPLDLIKHAEMAMFDAKNGARGTVRFYKKDRDGSALDDMAIANDLYKAIKNDELEMYYQPQQDIHKGILTGAEALVRWNHPRRGPISPAHFIPIAEESGAIIKLEEWIFDHVFRDMRVMAETLNDFPLNYVAVNVSSVHFLQPNFVEKFMRLIHKHRINPLWVNIEITESGIMRNIDEAIERIHELKRLGFSFSIDDFGTGYSSLTYLKKLPVDIIKIDRSFVKDADRDEEDRLIVESVIEISRKFGFKVLAEGIDRQETLDYFKTTACKTYQGYLYYKPISMSDFVQLI
jgi:EAL domain-containing protein (putative c-di-GMP-specific phosphodiesterase class I)